VRPAQLVFGFEHRPALVEESFLVAAENTEAVAWIDRWPDWPGRVLALHGPIGCGKTHLAHVWRRRSGADLLSASDLEESLLCTWSEAEPVVVVEDGNRVVDEAALFHLINLVRENDGFLLLTSQAPPARWSVALPDLRSRLSAIQVVGIERPGDDLIGAVLSKQFHDRQLAVPDDVIAYLVARMERSFAAVGSVVAALDDLSLAERRAITMPLARHVLEAAQTELDLKGD